MAKSRKIFIFLAIFLSWAINQPFASEIHNYIKIGNSEILFGDPLPNGEDFITDEIDITATNPPSLKLPSLGFSLLNKLDNSFAFTADLTKLMAPFQKPHFKLHSKNLFYSNIIGSDISTRLFLTKDFALFSGIRVSRGLVNSLSHKVEGPQNGSYTDKGITLSIGGIYKLADRLDLELAYIQRTDRYLSTKPAIRDKSNRLNHNSFDPQSIRLSVRYY